MRYRFRLFVIFSVGLLVLAAPVNTNPPAVKKEDVKPGNIYWSRVMFIDPKSTKANPDEGHWRHPVVVVSHVDAHDNVKIAQMTNKPIHGPVEPASNYADMRGHISVGPPQTLKIKRLKPPKDGVNAVRPGRLHPLINAINANCPPNQQLPGCESSGSAQHNTEHGRPEHDNSKKGSQQGSSNKGSSSQSSHPGNTMQSGQKSSSNQGNEPGGSKHGSRPGSPDDGWQVVTSRRTKKASKSRNR